MAGKATMGDYLPEWSAPQRWADVDEDDELPPLEVEPSDPPAEAELGANEQEWTTESNYKWWTDLITEGQLRRPRFRDFALGVFTDVLEGRPVPTESWFVAPDQQLRGMRKALLRNLQPLQVREQVMNQETGELFWRTRTLQPRPTYLNVGHAGLLVEMHPERTLSGADAGTSVSVIPTDGEHVIYSTNGNHVTHQRAIQACWTLLRLVDVDV